MSDPLSNLEIQDVLSSIRRLVSEDRMARETRAEEQPAPSGKLILTEAQRVEVAEEAADPDPRDEDATGGGAPVLHAFEEGRGAGAGRAMSSAIRPASVLEEDIASLESTIAELEAAVAGIGDFEPDGSEVEANPGDPETRALEDAFDEGFAVDAGGPGRFDTEDLSQPVAGAALTRDADILPTEEDATAPDADAAAEEVAFVRHDAFVRRGDWQVISGGEGVPSGSVARTGRLHLGQPSEDVEDSAAPFAADAEGVVEAADLSEGTADAAWPEASEAPAPEMSVPEDAPLAGPDEEWHAAPLAAAPDGAVPDAAPVAAAFPAAEAAPSDETEEDIGLFAPAEEAVMDMDMLRDLIAQVIREELQGPLGERITRNVRKLVRQEIARALEAQKLD